MKIKRNTCIFCEQNGSFKSDEHVISNWILDLLNIKRSSTTFNESKNHFTDNGEIFFKNEAKRTMNYDSYRSGYVCDKCNIGWMSQLESKIKPILSPLILGNKHSKSLIKEEKLLLARWTAKTTCVIDSVDPSDEPTPIAANPNDIRTMDGLPDGWAIFATTHIPTREVSYECNSKWFLNNTPSDEITKLLPHLRRTSIQIGRLILVSAFLDNVGLRLRGVRSIHYPIALSIPVEWLKKPAAGWICNEDLPLDSSENIQSKFSGALSLKVL